jgi:hypothetical protein
VKGHTVLKTGRENRGREIDAVLFVEPTVEIGWDRIFLLF